MIERNRNLREITKAKVAKAGINDSLRHTDLFGVFKRFGKEKNLGAEIYKTALYMDAIFGPDYTIETAVRLVGEPKKNGFLFPAELGKIYAIKYFAKLHKSTEDEKYLRAIENYETNIDKHVSGLAKRVLKEMKGGNK